MDKPLNFVQKSTHSSRAIHCAIHKINQRCRDKVSWIKGHPKRDDLLLIDPGIKDQEKWKKLRGRHHQRWKRNDWGIMIADSELKRYHTNDNLVGSYGNVFDHWAEYIFAHAFPMTKVVQQVLANYEVLYWIRNTQTPLLRPLKDWMQEYQFNKYVVDRDDDRERRGKGREYEGGAYALTARIWDIHTRPMKSSAWLAKANRHIFDKLMHGEHRALIAKPSEDREELARCPVCGKQDSNRHIIVSCSNPIAVTIRENAVRLMNEVMKEKRYGKLENRKYKWWGEIAIEQITNNKCLTNHLLWMGRWNDHHREELFNQVRPISVCTYTSTGEWQKARELLIDFGRITVNAVVDMYNARTEMCHELYQYSLSHTDVGRPIPPTPTHVIKQVEANIKYHVEIREMLKPISKEVLTLNPTVEQVEFFLMS